MHCKLTRKASKLWKSTVPIMAGPEPKGAISSRRPIRQGKRVEESTRGLATYVVLMVEIDGLLAVFWGGDIRCGPRTGRISAALRSGALAGTMLPALVLTTTVELF
jgi:hypothetical protein